MGRSIEVVEALRSGTLLSRSESVVLSSWSVIERDDGEGGEGDCGGGRCCGMLLDLTTEANQGACTPASAARWGGVSLFCCCCCCTSAFSKGRKVCSRTCCSSSDRLPEKRRGLKYPSTDRFETRCRSGTASDNAGEGREGNIVDDGGGVWLLL